MIKFSEFVGNNWNTWRVKTLTEAWEKAHKKMKAKMPYAYAGNVSKAPILWDKDDWKFLLQFPPQYWTAALMWRYDTGLELASNLREEHPNKTLDYVSDNGTVELPLAKDKKFVINNAYTGLKSLMEKLEKPVKYHLSHNPPGTTEGDKGVMDIDPFDENPTLPDGSPNPKYKENYKYGMHNYDITAPVQVSNEFIDSIPDDEVKVPKDKERTPENIRKSREAMKKNKRKDFAGMTALSRALAPRHMGIWYRAMGLGLLGPHPEKITDPHTGKEFPVSHVGMKDINKQLDSSVGGDMGYGQEIPIKMPSIKRTLNYKIVNKDGFEKSYSQMFNMPVLNPGQLLPRIVDMSPQQREIIAKRKGFEAEKECPGISGLNWADIEDKCPAAKEAGQVGDLFYLIKNFDILTPEQIHHLKMNKRDLLHLTSALYGTNEDKWSQPGEHYIVGFSPNKTKRGIEPFDMPKDQMKKVIDKYLPELTLDADKGIGYFLNTLINRKTGGYTGKLPPEVVQMIEMIRPDLAQVAGALLALNLQHPHLGVHDKEMGLKNVPEDFDPKSNEMYRRAYGYNLARDLSQAAFGHIGGRRQRQKQGVGALSLDAPTGSDETGSIGQNISDKGTGEGDWDTRRTEMEPQTQGEYDPVKGTTVYPIARMTWNVPKMEHDIDLFFGTRRNKLLVAAGHEYASLADRAKDRAKVIIETMQELYKKYAQEYMSKGLPQEEIEKRAQEKVSETLRSELAKKSGEFQAVTGDQIEKIYSQYKNQIGGRILTPELKQEEEDAWEIFFDDLTGKGHAYMPELSYSDEDKEYQFVLDGPKVTIDLLKGADAKKIAFFLNNTGGQEAIEKYGPKVLMAIKKAEGTPISHEEAMGLLHASGSIPKPQAVPVAPVAPAPQAQTAPVITAVNSLLDNLAKNHTTIINNKEYFKQNHQKIKEAYDKLIQQLKAKKNAGMALTPDENSAVIRLNVALKEMEAA